MAAGEEREHHVHRGESRPEEEHLGVRGRPLVAGGPGRAPGQPGRKGGPARGELGREVAEGEHGGAGAEGRLACELDAEPGSLRRERERAAHHHADAGAGGAEQLAEVPAVEPALEERLGVDRLATGREPAEEVRRLLGEGAHPAGGDVEEVLRLLGGVGHAAREGAGGVDEGDGPEVGEACERDGGERAARTSTDDDSAVRHAVDAPAARPLPSFARPPQGRGS